jgi:hypothetical protein
LADLEKGYLEEIKKREKEIQKNIADVAWRNSALFYSEFLLLWSGRRRIG